MRAVVCSAYGPPEEVALLDIPEPVPGPRQLLVAVHCAAVNFPDVLLIAGKYQVSQPVPFVPGSELAGEVLAAGAAAAFRPGDRVFGATATGAFAETAVLDADHAALVPDRTGFDEAAAFGVTYRTAYHTLRSVAAVSAGHRVVVLGAAGGVGLATVDVAVAMGARVIAAASSPEKLRLCRERGAEATIDYEHEDLRRRIRELTGDGAHAVIDPVGGPYAEPALRALRRGGTFVTVGYAAGAIPAIPLNLVLLKGITIRGFEMRTFPADQPAAAARDTRELMAMFSARKLRPYVGARFPLADTPKALRMVADRGALGKVVITVRP